MVQRHMRLAVVVAMMAMAGLLLPRTNQVAAEPPDGSSSPALAEQLKGTWVLVGRPGEVGEAPARGGRYKFYTGSCWCITQADANSGLVQYHHGGTYTLDGNKMTSIVQYAGESTKPRLGTTSHFEIQIEGDTYTQIGLDNPYTEVWKRVK